MNENYESQEEYFGRSTRGVKVPPKVTLNIAPAKATIYGQDIDRLMRDALKDNPIDKMVKLITKRHEIQQSINTLLPKMTADEITEVYHTLYRIAQKVNEREESK